MNSHPKDEFHFQTAGALMAFRVIIVSMLKTHPEPEKLMHEIHSVLGHPGAQEGQLHPPIQVVFDDLMQEMTSHLRERMDKKNLNP